MSKLLRARYLPLISVLSSSATAGIALVPPTPIVAAMAGALLVLPACDDDSKPDYWIKKLDDPPYRAKAVERLTQFFEDSLTNAGKDMSKPEVKELIEKLAEPLTKVYVSEYGALDEKARENLINLLASFRDARTEPALKKAFEEFGERGRGGKDVRYASRAVRDMKLKSAGPAVFAAFKKTRPSSKEGAYYRDLNEALLAVADSAWSAELIEMVNTDFPIIEQGKKPSPDQISQRHDTLYRTITAAQVLGNMGDAGAVVPLIRLILDPARADAANEALLALTKIGKPSVDAAVKLLKDEDNALAEFHKKALQKASGAPKPPEGSPHHGKAALILGAIGRTEGIKPMQDALGAAKDDAERAELLNSIAMLPHTPEVKATFVEGFKALPADATLMGGNASAGLSEAASLFFDPQLTAMLVSRAKDLKSDDKISKSLLALAAIKTMDESEVKNVDALVKSLVPPAAAKDKDGKEPEKDPLTVHLEKVGHAFGLAARTLEACKKDAACYLKEAAKGENQSDKDQLAGLKALYRIGQIQGPESANTLIEALGSLEEGAFRYIAAQVIDHHHPKGSTELADKLQAIIDKNAESMDKERSSADKPLRDAMYRLRARAQ